MGTTIAPAIAVVLYDAGIGPNTISTLPLVLAWMLPIYAWLLIGEQIIEFNPVAYETVFQNMQDPVIVVDDQDRVIGLNHGAEALLNISEDEAESHYRVFLGSRARTPSPGFFAASPTALRFSTSFDDSICFSICVLTSSSSALSPDFAPVERRRTRTLADLLSPILLFSAKQGH